MLKEVIECTVTDFSHFFTMTRKVMMIKTGDDRKATFVG